MEQIEILNQILQELQSIKFLVHILAGGVGFLIGFSFKFK